MLIKEQINKGIILVRQSSQYNFPYSFNFLVQKTYTNTKIPFRLSLLSLDHYDVVAELGLDGRVRVHGVAHVGHGQGEGGVLQSRKKKQDSLHFINL